MRFLNVQMTTRWFVCTAAQAAAMLMLIAGTAAGQSFPTKSIRLVLPFAPGGGTDALARIIGPKLGEEMGQVFVIDNRPGAAGNIAAADARRLANASAPRRARRRVVPA